MQSRSDVEFADEADRLCWHSAHGWFVRPGGRRDRPDSCGSRDRPDSDVRTAVRSDWVISGRGLVGAYDQRHGARAAIVAGVFAWLSSVSRLLRTRLGGIRSWRLLCSTPCAAGDSLGWDARETVSIVDSGGAQRIETSRPRWALECCRVSPAAAPLPGAVAFRSSELEAGDFSS